MIHARIAPTPSGYLHKGNALNFVITWLWVRRQNGVLRLRIDDLDMRRVKPEFITNIFDTLQWLGIDWDEGPQTPDEQAKKFSQSLRAERYAQLLQQLVDTGKVFACDCSRKDIHSQSGDQHHPASCYLKHTPLDTPNTALRLLTPPGTIITIPDAKAGEIKVDLYDQMRDLVVSRRDGAVAYQIASLADDTDHKINLIVRGGDLVVSTAAQLYIARLCGLDSFSETTFYHHPVIKDAAGNKLSKSAGSDSLLSWRQKEKTPENFYLWASEILGLERPVTSLKQMLKMERKRGE